MLEKIFEADTAKLHDVLDFIETELKNNNCNSKTQMMLLVICEEIFVNIALYAYPNVKNAKATITIDFQEDDVIIWFKDSGIEFNPLAKEDPDITLKAEDRNIGGLGIYMVKKTMDETKYERKDNNNILMIKKRIH